MVHWLTEVRNLPAPLPIRFNRMRLFSVLVASYFSFGFCFTGALPARISFCLSFFWAFRSSFFAIVYLGFCSCGFFLGLDRKSTRLNSSHVKISYAVFCLKKKT